MRSPAARLCAAVVAASIICGAAAAGQKPEDAAVALAGAGDYRGCARVVHRALQQQPERPDAEAAVLHSLRGSCMLRALQAEAGSAHGEQLPAETCASDDMRRAMADVQRAAALQPHRGDLLRNVIVAHCRCGRVQDGLREARRVQVDSTTDTQVLLAVQEAARRGNDTALWRAALRRVVHLDDTDHAAMHEYGEPARADRAARATRALTRAAARRPLPLPPGQRVRRGRAAEPSRGPAAG